VAAVRKHFIEPLASRIVELSGMPGLGFELARTQLIAEYPDYAHLLNERSGDGAKPGMRGTVCSGSFLRNEPSRDQRFLAARKRLECCQAQLSPPFEIDVYLWSCIHFITVGFVGPSTTVTSFEKQVSVAGRSFRTVMDRGR
jgi:hypothetical protein